jgi:hypothetical protein
MVEMFETSKGKNVIVRLKENKDCRCGLYEQTTHGYVLLKKYGLVFNVKGVQETNEFGGDIYIKEEEVLWIAELKSGEK